MAPTAEQNTDLAAAKAKEKEAQRYRREGHVSQAIDAYNEARDLYVDTTLQYGDDDVMRAIKRCDAIISNLRHPKAKRAAATTVRPSCLGCDKPLPRFKFDDKTYEDGTPREWGAYGDNRFCTLTCAWRWACAHAPMPKLRKSS
jgi:hypothetical protein